MANELVSSQQPPSHGPADIASVGPEIAFQKLLRHMGGLDKAFPDDPHNHEKEVCEWLGLMEKDIVFARRSEEVSGTVMAAGLAIVKKRWEELPLPVRGAYQNDFYKWAVHRTGRAVQTIDNYIRVAQTFVLGGAGPEFVDIPERDKDSRIVKDVSGKTKLMRVKFDPLAIDISKLILTRHRVEANQMRAEDWMALTDPGCSWEALQLQLYGAAGGGGGGSGTPGGQPRGISYQLAGPVLVAQEGDVTVELGELNWDRYYEDENSLEHRALSRLLLILGVRLDEVILRQEGLKKENQDAYGT